MNIQSEYKEQTLSRFSKGMNVGNPTQLDPEECSLIENMDWASSDYGLHLRDGTFFFLRSNAVPNNRWTSLYQPLLLDTNQQWVGSVYGTSGTKMYKADGSGYPFGLTDLGVADIPNNKYFQWVRGVDGAKVMAVCGGDKVYMIEPLVSETAVAASTWGGSYLGIKYAANWNSRTFVCAPRVEPNTLRYTALGAVPDGSAGGNGFINIAPGEDDYISGISEFNNGSFFVLKRRHIYRIKAGDPITDATKWEVKLVSEYIGCTSAYSIRKWGKYLIFLGDDGVYGIHARESLSDDYTVSLLSKTLRIEPNNLAHSYPGHVGIMGRNLRPYYIVSYSEESDNGNQKINDTCYAVDLRSIQYNEQDGTFDARWVKYGWPYTAACFMILDGASTGLDESLEMHATMIGGYNQIYQTYYGSTSDNEHPTTGAGGTPIIGRVITPAFTHGTIFKKKAARAYKLHCLQYGSAVPMRIDTVIDEDYTKIDTKTFTQTASASNGGKYGTARYGTDRYVAAGNPYLDVIQPLSGSAGRQYQSILFDIKNTGLAAESLIISELAVDVRIEGDRGVNKI